MKKQGLSWIPGAPPFSSRKDRRVLNRRESSMFFAGLKFIWIRKPGLKMKSDAKTSKVKPQLFARGFKRFPARRSRKVIEKGRGRKMTIKVDEKARA